MEPRIGLDYIVENKEYTTKLASGKTFFYDACAVSKMHRHTSNRLNSGHINAIK
jgi:hypothetical protein